jgi:hypothetical protein
MSCFGELSRYIDDEDNSTVAGSDLENDVQGYDCESAEDVDECQSLLKDQSIHPHVCRPFTSRGTEAAKRSWADIVDSDDEGQLRTPSDKNVAMSLQGSQPQTGRWADLVDSDTDEEAELSGKSRSSGSSAEVKVNAEYSESRTLETTCAVLNAKQVNSKALPYRNDGSKGKGKCKGLKKAVALEASAKGSGKSRYTSDYAHTGRKGSGKGSGSKLQCQFIIGIEEDQSFRVVKRIIGNGNMRRIAESTHAKLRLRGRGSNFLEGPEQLESNDDLMLCVSCQDKIGFEEAQRLVSELLNDIYSNYEAFCRKTGKPVPDLSIQVHDGYRQGSW